MKLREILLWAAMKLREILSVFPLVSRNAHAFPFCFPPLPAPLLLSPQPPAPLPAAAAHCLAVDADGRCYSWGRNEVGGDAGTGGNGGKRGKRGNGGKREETGKAGKRGETGGNGESGETGGNGRKRGKTGVVGTAFLGVKGGECGMCGQLGHGHQTDLNQPTIIEALAGKRIVAVASGRNHSLAVADDGSAWAWGSNKHGQLGTGSLKTEHEKKPVLSAVKRVRAVACGGEFSCWITHPDPSTTTATTPPSNDATTTKAAAAAGGGGAGGAAQPSKPPSPPNLFTAGLPQYGQLGHGTDNEYNAKDSAVKLVYAPQPTPRAVAALAGREMCKVACGINHTVAVDAKGFVFTWGFGGFGRLGHKEQKDEWRPRLVDVFQRQNTLPPTAVVAAGGAFSACTAGGGQMYAWGKVKQTGDCWMYPKPLLDLSGWHIRSMACGATTSCVAADSSTISWGLAQHGELGYGPNGAKSSANPKKIDSLEGIHSVQVAGGVGFFLHLVSRTGAPGDSAEQRSKAEKLLAALPLFTPEPDTTSQKPAGKGKAAGTGRARKKEEKEEAVVEEEGGDEEGGEEDEDEEVEEVDTLPSLIQQLP
ncbi:unnamed protein product [Closterium sp. Naga37s-1]|nr:unnamed protein product [Closterium sp. Naga37s-1]